jgi:beta-lactamase class A
MKFQMSRRGLLVGAAAMACAGRFALAAVEGGAGVGADAQPAHGRAVGDDAHPPKGDAAKQLAALEKHEGGRLGVEAWDTGSGKRIQHRSDERFAMCSVFKFLAAGAILKRVDQGTEHLDRRIEFSESDLLEYAPVAKEHVKEGGLTLGELCAAAVEWSDNTAANLMLKVLGGPQAVTSFIRSTGDQITRLDNIEPALNVVRPGEVHDTTTASSMAGLLDSVVLGKVLSAENRSRLEGWMLDAKVGELRLQAGLPTTWRIAHKTGTYGDQTNDVGIIWPPNRAPIIVAALYSRGGTRTKQREGVLREVGRIIAASV